MKKTRYSPGHLPTLDSREEDEIMMKIVQEHVGCNNEVVIRRGIEGKPDSCDILPCDDYPTGETLFVESANKTLKQAYISYCDKHGIIPF